MSAEDDALLGEFLAESREHLADIETDLLAVEEAGANIDEDLVNKVFRAAHSIKGGSGFFGLRTIQELAHGAETVLDLIRSREMVPNPEIVNILLQAFDQLRVLMQDVGSSNQVDITEHVVALQGLASSYLPGERKASLTHKVKLQPEGRSTPLSVPEIDVAQALRRGQYIYLASYDMIHDIERLGKTPLDVIRSLSTCGVVLDAFVNVDAVGSLDDPPARSLPLEIVYATVVEPGLSDTVFEIPEEQIQVLKDPRSSPTSVSVDPPGLPGHPREEAAPAPTPVAVSAPAPAAPAPKAAAAPAQPAGGDAQATPAGADATIRISVNLLDSLMNLAGELVLSRNQLREAIVSDDRRSVSTSSQRINLVTSDLQAAIMQARMQPVGNVFGKFPRVVRDLARELSKEIRLVIDGRDVELDKTLIEGLSDPLNHMVRNAVDHGVETPAARVDAGKTATGTITLKAFHEAGQVVLEVGDDGKGIDAQRVAASALAKGLVTADELKAMSPTDKLGLIFLPGLSTAEKVTDVSGRGVGMDVVKTNLDRLGGKVEISSTPGQGTLFRIKLPLTLAIIPSLVVSVGAERFAVPQLNVVELIRIPAGEIHKRIEVVGEAEVLVLRGELVPLVHFADILGVERTYVDEEGHVQTSRRQNLADRRSPRYDADGVALSEPLPGKAEWRKEPNRRFHASSDLNVVIMSSGLLDYGLVVEGLHKTEEIVVKPLGRHLKGLPEYAGATIMGDGSVALILDAAGIAGKAELRAVSGHKRAMELAEESQRDRSDDAHSLLVYRNNPREACAVPLDLVLRVERINRDQLETVGGRRTMQYRGATLPLVSLADAANVAPVADDQELAVIVVSVAGREVGVLGAMPVDVVETRAAVDQTTLRQRGVVGSSIIKNTTVLLVDVFELVEAVFPEWASREKVQSFAPPAAGEEPPLVLLAEDSDFFRGQVKRFIEAEGYKVIAAEDGQAAWEKLQANADRVRLVVTDIEMPRMTGLGLAQHIRADGRFADLPVIGLTSLAGEEDIARGRAAGITDYQIKLDRDRLLDGIRALLAGSERAPASV
jgi:two-component system, chemotaxis family, sensor kinase CheA